MTINDLKLAAKDNTLFWEVIYEKKWHKAHNLDYLERGTYIYSKDRNRYLFLTDNLFLNTINLSPSELLDLLNNCEVDGRVNILFVDGRYLIHW